MTAAGASHSVFDYLDRQPVQKPTGYHQPEEFRGNIQFEQVSLSYPARPDEMAVQVSVRKCRKLNSRINLEHDLKYQSRSDLRVCRTIRFR